MDRHIDLKDLTRSGGKRSRLAQQSATQVLRRPNAMPDLYRRSPQLRKSQSKKQSSHAQDQYQTDSRKRFQYDLELQQLRKLVSQCQHCRARLPEFITKKPKYELTKLRDAETQASIDSSLFRLLEEKIEEIERYNRNTVKELKRTDQIIRLKEEELDEMEERFTGVVYAVSEDVFLFHQIQKQYNHLKVLASSSQEVPAFLKCLALDDTIHASSHG